ncbi:class I SAM-dependent methyltransferase [Streptomyces cyaneofuscatus]|uniref:class I SAM-dependent methyltransferase n=1 Tax=Streptomyces cyaneofuscatus TaxID=66883 RepID=UPI0033BCF962
MSTTDVTRYAPEWLALREGADASARASDLLEPLRLHLLASENAAEDREGRAAPLVIRDLGCGTGSMGRWLAPRLGGRQHWILHDHDPRLLGIASARLPRQAADGGLVTAETEQGDVSGLTAARLMGTSLVTASALLDLLTREELDALVAACAGAGCAMLLALSVVGRVDLSPADPMDAEIEDAFNAHQRRVERGRRLLGPDAVAAASLVFARRGMTVRVQDSPWHLGAGAVKSTATVGGEGRPGREGLSRQLMTEWLQGWVGAASKQRPALASRAEAYVRRRLDECAAGELSIVVHHSDVLALPGRTVGIA